MTKDIKKIFLISLLGTLLISCGSVRVYVKPNTEFSRQMSLTLTGSDNDKAGLIGELQFALTSNGFNVVSESVARNGINLSQEGQLDSDSFDLNSNLYKSLELKSVYALNSRYNLGINPLTYSITISSFQAELVDLYTGEVVISLSFRGNRTPQAVAKRVVEELNKQMKKG
jgi:hypothetical protein